MKICDVLKDVDILESFLYNPNKEIFGIKKSENDVGNVFVCLNGEKFNSHLLSLKSINADVFIVEEIDYNEQKMQIKVENAREILLKILINFNKIDVSKIKVIGITGTNGKTTIATFTGFLLEKLGKSVATLGTNGLYLNKKNFITNLTTPEPFEFVKYLSLMQKNGVEYLVMEVSAHAIKQFRVYGLNFVAKAVTNLTQDHLDDFYSLEEYAYFKYSFTLDTPLRLINIDNRFGAKFVSCCGGISVSNKRKAKIQFKNKKDILSIKFFNKNYSFKHNQKTPFNVFNLVISICFCLLLNFKKQEISKFTCCMPKVSGRYNLITFGKRVICIDYAHTPDAIKNVLKDLKGKFKSVITVFGSSGYRDCLKREIMGKIASKYSDFIILTADNPKNENVKQICAQIASGIGSEKYVVIEKRAEAIKYAFSICKCGAIAILGKGNEEFQECKTNEKYNDFDVVKNLIYRE